MRVTPLHLVTICVWCMMATLTRATIRLRAAAEPSQPMVGDRVQLSCIVDNVGQFQIISVNFNLGARGEEKPVYACFPGIQPYVCNRMDASSERVEFGGEQEMRQGRYTVSMPRADVYNSGLFICEVQHTTGRVEASVPFTVFAEPSKPSLELDKRETEHHRFIPTGNFLEKDQVTVTCEANLGFPEGSLQLSGIDQFGDDIETVQSSVREEDSTITETKSAKLPALTADNNGDRLLCEVQVAREWEMKNPKLAAQMRTEKVVSVYFGPRNPVINENINSKTGQTVSLTCAAEGHPSPSFTWSQLHTDGRKELIKPEQLAGQLGDTLTLNGFDAKKNYTFECNASNTLGEALAQRDIYLAESVTEEQVRYTARSTSKEGEGNGGTGLAATGGLTTALTILSTLLLTSHLVGLRTIARLTVQSAL